MDYVYKALDIAIDVKDEPLDVKDEVEVVWICEAEAEYGAKKEHLLEESDQSPSRCDLCQAVFIGGRVIDLVAHRYTHTEDAHFSCCICYRTYFGKQQLKAHIFRQHESAFECNFCGRRYATSALLIRHRRFHTGEKPHECQICHKRFTASTYLIKHKRIHTGEKPYQCDVCHKRFAVDSNLASHKTTHFNERRYECKVCHKLFKQCSGLARHKRKKHPAIVNPLTRQ